MSPYFILFISFYLILFYFILLCFILFFLASVGFVFILLFLFRLLLGFMFVCLVYFIFLFVYFALLLLSRVSFCFVLFGLFLLFLFGFQVGEATVLSVGNSALSSQLGMPFESFAGGTMSIPNLLYLYSIVWVCVYVSVIYCCLSLPGKFV